MKIIKSLLGISLLAMTAIGCCTAEAETAKTSRSVGPSHAAKAKSPYLYVLGIGQDGAYPQAGCFKPHCMPGWENPKLRHPATSIALIDPAAKTKYLFEATPNFPEQYYALEKEAPTAQFRLGGVFVTHAHIGHYAGLMHFGQEVMGAKNVPVYAMPRMREFLKTNGPWSQLVNYGNIALQPLEADIPTAIGDLTVTPLRVPHRDEFSETVGFVIKGPTKSALFIPDIDVWEKWNRDLKDVIAKVDYALIDATFYSMDELPGRDMTKVPHPLVAHSIDLLKDLPAQERNKVWFIHINHGNPLLRTNSPQYRNVKRHGMNVAHEGLRLPL